jgi:hypothetical protein
MNNYALSELYNYKTNLHKSQIWTQKKKSLNVLLTFLHLLQLCQIAFFYYVYSSLFVISAFTIGAVFQQQWRYQITLLDNDIILIKHQAA